MAATRPQFLPAHLHLKFAGSSPLPELYSLEASISDEAWEMIKVAEQNYWVFMKSAQQKRPYVRWIKYDPVVRMFAASFDGAMPDGPANTDGVHQYGDRLDNMVAFPRVTVRTGIEIDDTILEKMEELLAAEPAAWHLVDNAVNDVMRSVMRDAYGGRIADPKCDTYVKRMNQYNSVYGWYSKGSRKEVPLRAESIVKMHVFVRRSVTSWDENRLPIMADMDWEVLRAFYEDAQKRARACLAHEYERDGIDPSSVDTYSRLEQASASTQHGLQRNRDARGEGEAAAALETDSSDEDVPGRGEPSVQPRQQRRRNTATRRPVLNEAQLKDAWTKKNRREASEIITRIGDLIPSWVYIQSSPTSAGASSSGVELTDANVYNLIAERGTFNIVEPRVLYITMEAFMQHAEGFSAPLQGVVDYVNQMLRDGRLLSDMPVLPSRLLPPAARPTLRVPRSTLPPVGWWDSVPKSVRQAVMRRSVRVLAFWFKLSSRDKAEQAQNVQRRAANCGANTKQISDNLF